MPSPVADTPTSAPVSAPVRRRPQFAHPASGALAALVVLTLASAIVTPNFATADNLWNILWQASGVVLVGIGMTIVIATGGVDLSVGSVMAVAGAVAAVRLDQGGGPVAAAGLALVAALAVGFVNGGLVARNGSQPIVVTLATLIAGRGIAQVLSRDGQLVPIRDAAFDAIGRGRLGPVPVPVLVAGAVVAAVAVTFRMTLLGRYVLAVGGNRRAARLAGVPVGGTLIAVYAISGVLAGLAGLLEAARIGASDAAKIGLNMELDGIAAAVVGGTALAGGRATMLGAVAGALVMQVIATSFNMLLVPYAWSLVFKAIIIVIAVAAQRSRRA